MTLSGIPITVNPVSQMIENKHQFSVMIPKYDFGGAYVFVSAFPQPTWQQSLGYGITTP